MHESLTGWVRNLRDGRVEALLCGEDAAVERVLTWMKEGGPPAGSVTELEVHVASEESPPDFVIAATPPMLK